MSGSGASCASSRGAICRSRCLASPPLDRHREATAAFCEQGHEIASHGLRWIHHQHMGEERERQHITLATLLIRELTGGSGRMAGTPVATARTPTSGAGHGGFEYDSDYYGDDLPFYLPVAMADGSIRRQLIVPYTLDANDRSSRPRPALPTDRTSRNT